MEIIRNDPLINCKIELSLTWNPTCVLCNLLEDSTFTITDVPVVTLSIEDNTKISKLLNKGFKRQVSWIKYKIIPSKTYDANYYIRERIMLVIKELRDCLFLLTEIVVVLIEVQLILTEDTSFQE